MQFFLIYILNVSRFTPPLVITEEELRKSLDIIKSTLLSFESQI